jgi:hypothetical protein
MTIEETQTQTMVDTVTYLSTATATDFQTATVTSVSVSTLIQPTTYFSTVLSTRVVDNVSIPSQVTFVMILINPLADHDRRRYHDGNDYR